MTPTWIVWSEMPPECLEKIVHVDAMLRARGDRQFRKGFMPRNGTELRVYAENDLSPRQSTYRVKITIVNAPRFARPSRASRSRA